MTNALLELTENIIESSASNALACEVFLVLQKVFDTVNPLILLKKLEYQGIRGKCKQWFE